MKAGCTRADVIHECDMHGRGDRSGCGTLDIEDVRDISRVRILIEGEGLREAIEHTDVEYEASVVASHHRLSRTQFLTGEGGETVTEDWARAHAEYHSALLSACPSRKHRQGQNCDESGFPGAHDVPLSR